MNTLADQTSTTTAGYPLPRRVADTFFSPGRLFEHFRVHSPWIGPLLITIVVGVAAVLLIPADLFVEQAREAMRERGNGASTPDPATIARFGRIMGALAVLIGQPVIAFLLAGILALVFTTILGGDARYKQYLAITTHVLLILALGTLVTLPLQIIRGDLELQLSLSLLAPFLDPEGIPFRFLQGLNIFALWALVVAALGVSIVNRRPSWTTASGVLLCAYLALVASFAVIGAALAP